MSYILGRLFCCRWLNRQHTFRPILALFLHRLSRNIQCKHDYIPEQVCIWRSFQSFQNSLTTKVKIHVMAICLKYLIVPHCSLFQGIIHEHKFRFCCKSVVRKDVPLVEVLCGILLDSFLSLQNHFGFLVDYDERQVVFFSAFFPFLVGNIKINWITNLTRTEILKRICRNKKDQYKYR